MNADVMNTNIATTILTHNRGDRVRCCGFHCFGFLIDSLNSRKSTRQNFAYWLACGAISRGWARSAYGNTGQGIAWIEDGIRDYRATGSMIDLPYFLSLRAEALHLADRTPEAIQTIREAEAPVERFDARFWSAELHRLRGMFLAAMGADETQIEASFQEAIGTTKKQKSVSLQKRAEATYAEYRRQKASASGGRGFRLPLW